MHIALGTSGMFYSKESRSFITERSDHQLRYWPSMVTLKSHLTGENRTFYQESVETDHEREVLAYHYRNPSQNLKLVILND